MARDTADRDQQNQTAAPQAEAAAPPKQVSTQDPLWAGSAETASAKDAARGPQTPSTEAAAQLEDKVPLPSPIDEMTRQLPLELPPEAIEEMKAQEQSVRRNALARAYEAVMTGSAAAAGNPEAKAALDAAPAPMAQLAADVESSDAAGGGAPLPAPTREKMEALLDEDFSDVRVQPADAKVADAGAGAAAGRETVHFAPGRFDPTTPEGEALIAHELTHLKQKRTAAEQGGAHVPGSGAQSEQEAEKVQDAVLAKGEMPDVARGSAPADAVHLGEAGVHQGIELEAAGVIKPGTDPHKRFDPDNLTPEQKKSLEMYAGNFMRDFSQFQCPKALFFLSQIPSATGPNGQVGGTGAVALADAVIQCIGILELGTDIGKRLIKPQNVGVYEAEHHIDNPMGTGGQTGPGMDGLGDYITRGTGKNQAHLASSPEARCITTSDAPKDCVAVTPAAVAEDEATHSGSAVPGLQYENQSLYEVGSGGLTNHIANSTEHCKGRFLDAVRLGPTPEGRMNVGMGQHIIEDYFSHSNYIEVALNRYINDAVTARKQKKDAAGNKSPEGRAAVNAFFNEFIDADGKPKEGALSDQPGVNAEFAFVDSLYDARDKNGRQAVTTGTFGGTDTVVSLGHVLLPRLPTLETALHKGVDSIFGVVHEMTKKDPPEPATWQKIQGLLEGKGRNGAVAQVMLGACDTAGLAVPCPSGFEFTMKELGSLPLLGSISVPNGVKLTHTNIPITGAIETGAATYVSLMQALDQFEKFTGIAAVKTAIEAIKATIRAAMEQLAAAIRRQMSTLISELIQKLFNINPKDAAHAGVAELASLAGEQMHELEEKTSMETRMAEGDLAPMTKGGEATKAALEAKVGPVRPRDPNGDPAKFGTESNPWVTVNPLPPSHSEISKDHPPHKHDDGHPEWHKEGANNEKEALEELKKEGWDKAHGHDHNEDEDEHSHEDHAGGSAFFELHYQLALEADKHMMDQLSTIWGQSITGKEASKEAVDANGAMGGELVGPEEAWVTSAREYNNRSNNAAHVAAFNAATGNQYLGHDGQPDPHLVKQWQEAKGLTGDGKIGPKTAESAEKLGPASSLTPMAAGENGRAVSHESMLRAAQGVANQAAGNAKEDKIKHAQSDPALAEQMSDGRVANLLNLVDYFMSHPGASQWWVGIFDSYVAEHGEEVHGAILSRNKTRSRRGPG